MTANFTRNGATGAEVWNATLGGVQAYASLATVNVTGTLVVDVMVTTAQNQANTFWPAVAIIESLA